MTSRLTLTVGLLALVLAGCESGGPGMSIGVGGGGVGGAVSVGSSGPRSAVEEQKIDGEDEAGPAGEVIGTDLGYPVQDERPVDTTGF
jgi:hypothetical protein